MSMKPRKKFAPIVPRKSALNAKIDAVMVEHSNDEAKLRAKLEELNIAVAEAGEHHVARLAEKT